jgi:hypothetical protein
VNAHLYVVKHDIDGEPFFSACVGDAELFKSLNEYEHFGARLDGVLDVEIELRRFVFDCYFEGALKEWYRELA